VCDAGPLIHLEQLGCLDLLRDFVEVRVADAVWQEVRRHQPSALRHRSVPLTHVPTVPQIGTDLARLSQALVLDAGERAALALMAEAPEPRARVGIRDSL
jgi:predicted nucleic acid-binding protein